MRAYQQSKLANVMFTYELSRRLEGTGVTANVMHPGLVHTNIGRSGHWLVNLVQPVWFRRGISPQEGAETIIYLASSPEVDGITGKYFYKKEPVPTLDTSYDEEAQRRLWALSEKLVGLDQ
jgi:NAD(P)-dependent dehydrogenase (short-subunit alcohol dehydrogenase family)